MGTVPVTRQMQEFRRSLVDAVVPYAITFLAPPCKPEEMSVQQFCEDVARLQGRTAEEFRQHLLQQEAAAAAQNRTTGLGFRGVNVAALNGEVDDAMFEAKIYFVLRRWYDHVSFQRKPPGMYEFLQAHMRFSDEEMCTFKPAIDRAFHRCVGVR